MALATLRLMLANLLIPVAILVFATGFFPYKPFMTGLAEYEELGWEDSMRWEATSAPEAPFDKLVFMVVDALRSDFVFSEESGMAYVQSLIRDGFALPFTAHATSPTITMPRVKAMTTGSIPSFLDVILNFAESDTTSTLATQDTWLAQIRAKDYGQPQGQGKLVMYGDDTWLKLFPDFFKRADGTSSFFVSDFTEVDNNVTRHVPEELLNSDWNAMILHYLGLDHIGHKAGPRSPNMIPKQKEMDGMVRTIYEAIENEDHLSNTLFVLCGDHGMNDGGNHGGSAPGETSPALVFMSPKLRKITESTPKESPTKPKNEGEFEYYRMIEQSDIAPTLAGLMGFPVPKNNLGVFIEEFLKLWDNRADHIKLLLRNAKQMKMIVQATYSSLTFGDKILEKDAMGFECFSPDETKLTDGQALACLWQRILAAMRFDAEEPQMTIPAIYEFIREAQSSLSSTASNYDVSRLNIGYALTAPIMALAFRLPKGFTVTPSGLFYAIILGLYFVLVLASSYVEEEHNFWYWMTSGWLFYLFLKEMRKEWFGTWIFHPAIMALSIHRIARRWNQAGQKFAGADDIVTSGIFLGRNSIVLWGLVGATYLDLTLRLSRHIARSIATFDEESKSKDDEYEASDVNKMVGTLGVLPLGATAFVFKLAFTEREAPELVYGISPSLLDWASTLNLVGLARMVFGGLALSASWIILAEWQRSKRRAKRGKQGNGSLAIAMFDLISLFLITQTKAQNIPLYLLFRLQFFFLSILNLTPTAVTITTLLLTQTSFFCLGNTNAISSIDLSNSYNGISGYNVGAVGLLVFLSNWAGPIYWSIAGVILLGNHGRAERYINTAELDTRDWVTKEHEFLNDMARKEEESRERRRDPLAWRQHAALLTLWTGLSLHAVMLACTVLRTHLFIWTVFSPKYLYAMAWGTAFHLGVTMGLGKLVWWFGGW